MNFASINIYYQFYITPEINTNDDRMVGVVVSNSDFSAVTRGVHWPADRKLTYKIAPCIL